MLRARAAVFLLLCAAGTPAPAQTPPRSSSSIIAVVENVDVLRRTVTVVDTWGGATEFRLGSNARIAVSRNSVEELATIDDLKPGQRVQVTFTGPIGDPESIRVTVLPLQYDRPAP
jgi:hypothetical protein